MMPRRLFWLIFGGGLALRLLNLAAALWYDEAFSAWLAQLPLQKLFEAAWGDVHPPGYYLLLWGLNIVLGHSEAVLRLPSVLAGLALIYVVYRLAHALEFDKNAIILATSVAAFSPFQIYYSQEARTYEILTLAVSLAALGLLHRRWGLAIAGSLAALYLHNMAGLFVAAAWLGAMAYHGEWKPFILPGLAAAAGALPAGFFLSYQVGAVGSGYWVPPITSPGRWLATLDDLLWFLPNNPFVIASGLITAFTLILIFKSLLANLRAGSVDAPVKFLAAAVLGPLLLVTLASLLWQPVLISRVMAPIAPFYYLWLAWAVTRSRPRLTLWLATAAPTAALILAAMAAGPIGRQPVNMDMLTTMRQADAVYHANLGTYIVWKYYLPDTPQFVWPQDNSLAESLTPATKRAMGVEAVDFEAVSCAPYRHWVLIFFNNPTTSQSEMDYMAHLERDYPAQRVKMLRSDPTSEAWLVKIEPDCYSTISLRN